MNLITVTPDFKVAADLKPEEVNDLIACGVRSVISTLPDASADAIPASEAMRGSVEAASASFAHVPVVIGLITPEQIDDFANALAASDGPVVAYCHSGLRAMLLWALAKKDDLGLETVIDIADRAGFDIAPYVDEDSEALLAA